MTILVAVKKNDRVYLGADRITTFGNEYSTDLVNGSKIIKLKHAYLATSGYTLLDNVIEHLYAVNHKMMDNTFRNRAEVFSFFLELFGELKKNYTLVDVGKDTYATMYNVFLLVTPTSIYGISNNLAVHEYERFAAKGAGADYAQGCLYGVFDLMEDGFEITRLALEAACHFSIYCKEPLDILYVDAKQFGGTKGGYKQHQSLKTMHQRQGTRDLVAIARSKMVAGKKDEVGANGRSTVKPGLRGAAKTSKKPSVAAAGRANKASALKSAKSQKKTVKKNRPRGK